MTQIIAQGTLINSTTSATHSYSLIVDTQFLPPNLVALMQNSLKFGLGSRLFACNLVNADYKFKPDDEVVVSGYVCIDTHTGVASLATLSELQGAGIPNSIALNQPFRRGYDALVEIEKSVKPDRIKAFNMTHGRHSVKEESKVSLKEDFVNNLLDEISDKDLDIIKKHLYNLLSQVLGKTLYDIPGKQIADLPKEIIDLFNLMLVKRLVDDSSPKPERKTVIKEQFEELTKK